jgi:hypothetical protein
MHERGRLEAELGKGFDINSWTQDTANTLNPFTLGNSAFAGAWMDAMGDKARNELGFSNPEAFFAGNQNPMDNPFGQFGNQGFNQLPLAQGPNATGQTFSANPSLIGGGGSGSNPSPQESNMPFVPGSGDLEGFRNLIMGQAGQAGLFGSNPTLNALNQPGALDAFSGALAGLPSGHMPMANQANQFLSNLMTGGSPVPRGEFSGVFDHVGAFGGLDPNSMNIDMGGPAGGGGGNYQGGQQQGGGGSVQMPGGTITGIPAGQGGGGGGQQGGVPPTGGPTPGGYGGYAGGGGGGGYQWGQQVGDVAGADALGQAIPGMLEQGGGFAQQGGEAMGNILGGGGPLTQQLIGQAGGGAFDPRQVADPSIQNPLQQQLTSMLQTGGLSPEFIQANKELLLDPALDRQEGQFNRQTKGAAISGPSGVAAAQRAEIEKGFNNAMLQQAFGAQQNALGQANQLGSQQFGQGMANAQLPAQLTQALAGVQGQLTDQQLGAAGQLGNLGLGQSGQGIQGVGTLGDIATQLFGIGTNRDLGFAGLDVQSQLGNRGLDVESQLGNRGIDVQSQLGNRGFDIESQLGNRGLDVQSQLGNRGLGIEQQLGLGNLGLQRELGMGGLGLQRELGMGNLGLQAQGQFFDNLNNLANFQLGLGGLNENARQADQAAVGNVFNQVQGQMTSSDMANLAKGK